MNPILWAMVKIKLDLGPDKVSPECDNCKSGHEKLAEWLRVQDETSIQPKILISRHLVAEDLDTFFKVLAKAWDYVTMMTGTTHEAPSGPPFTDFTFQETENCVLVLGGLATIHHKADGESVLSFSPFQSPRTKAAAHAFAWRLANALEWSCLPDRQKLSYKKLSRTTWDKISIYIDPLTLKKQERPRNMEVDREDDYESEREEQEDENSG